MNCPYCLANNSFVKDSREIEEGKVVRRRRHCAICLRKFTTFERVQIRSILVVKRSGAKKMFDREKIYESIATALRKRNVSNEQINQITTRIVIDLEASNTKEIPTRKIGELIMQELAKIDQVAYIRFASVYKDFTNAQDFAKFVSKI